MGLLLFTSPDDVRAMVKYLMPKASGASIREAKAVLGAKGVDDRKISAYQALGIIIRDDDRIKLTTDVGREMARASEESFKEILRQQLMQVPAYNGCVEWAYHKGLAELIASDVGAHWHDNYRDELGTNKPDQINERAVCFLKLASGAGLGEFVVGRRGQLSRLVLCREVVQAVVEGNGSNGADKPAEEVETDLDEGDPGDKPKADVSVAERSRPLGQGIFIAHGKNKKPLEQLKRILDQFKVPYKVAVDEPNLGRPIGAKIREVMHACNCAVLIFTADEEFRDKDGNSIWRPSENVIYELGASGFLYDNRMVIMKEETVQFPSNFRDIGYISFCKDQLDAKAMDILKELIGFGIVKVTT